MSLDTEISILIKINFVDFLVRIIPDNECTTNIDFFLYNEIYSFTYNMKTTKLGQFPD